MGSGQQVSSAQIRSARGLLGISAQDLAKLANVGWATIQRYEAAEGIPNGRAEILERIRHALEAEGIEFLGDPLESPGVRLKPR